MSRKFVRIAGYCIYLFLAVFILLEIGLRVYNPFHFRLKGDRIVLPANQKQIITNRINPKLDSVIVNTRNSLGFRGEELPSGVARSGPAAGSGLAAGGGLAAGADTGAAPADGLLKVIAVGGSTTECHFLTDDKTWPYLLGKKLSDSFTHCWLNNAGLDGHSTYGHIVLLNGLVKQLRPSVVLFLTGINDVENNAPTFHDKLNTRGAFADLKHYLVENSEVLSLVVNLSRGWKAQRFNNTTNALLVLDSSRRLVLSDTVVTQRLRLQAPYLLAYRQRLQQLADTCTAWHILPVFITQPNLFGVGRDPVTGADLALYPTDDADPKMNGRLIWSMLEKYNDVTRSMCAEKGYPLIDLASEMPKNSLYFYDMSHFTNAGAERVASIVDSALVPVLDKYFAGYRQHL